MTKNKDWSGNQTSIFSTLGSSSHSKEDRHTQDYYATDPKATEWLMKLENFNSRILEPACGEGHISNVLSKKGYLVDSYDLIDRGFGRGGYDFLTIDNLFFDGDVVTNPPYSLAKEFVEKSLQIIPEGNKVAMFLKIQFLETKDRKEFFKENPPVRVWVSSSRIMCAKNGNFKSKESSAVCYCWFIWEKGFKGETVLKWFN